MGILSFFRGDRPEQTKQKRFQPPRIVFRGYGEKAGMPEAADTDHLTAGWTTTPASILRIVERTWLPLCARGREASINTDHGKHFLRLLKQNVIGPKGIVVVPLVKLANGTPDTRARKALREAYEEWGREPEVTGTMTIRDMDNLIIETVARDGECFIRRLRGRRYGKFHYQNQLIDPVRVPVNYRTKLPNGNRVRAGIEFTPEGKPVAHYVRADLDDCLDAVEYSGAKYERIPASDMWHIFAPEFINQPRGLSWMGTALTRLHHLSKFETAAVINARLGASKMGFFEADPEFIEDEVDEDGNAFDEFPMDADPGSFERLPTGYRLKEWNPQYPHGDFQPFTDAVLHSVSAGLGVAFASLSGRLGEGSYSSNRSGEQTEQDRWIGLQSWYIEKIARARYEEWVSVAVLAGAVTIGNTPLKVERVGQYKAARYQGRRWSWWDPSKDIPAHKKAQDARMRSISSSIRERGDDPDEVFDEIAEEREKMAAKGILPEPDKTPATATKAEEDEDEDNAAKTEH